MEITTRRRRALSTALALLLAVESVSAVAAAAVVASSGTGSPDGVGAVAPAAVARAELAVARADAMVPAAKALAPTAVVRIAPAAAKPALADSAAQGPARTVAPAAPARPFARIAAASVVKKPRAASSGGSSAAVAAVAASPRSYKGRNHFWFPSVGINRAVYSFSCSRSREPDNLVYRWGCAGANNVYLLGHAHSVFKPLHDAYVSGRLKVGMKAWYADSRGRTHTYVVKWWKLTRPTTSASWAWAAQAVPSMTLQTCVGSNSEYRLMVRLVEVR